jgi:plastocyanin
MEMGAHGTIERTHLRVGIVAVVAAALLFGAAARATAAVTTQVHLVGGAPNPTQVTIDDGDFVAFVNDDDAAHAIFALGEQRGSSIPPHRTSDLYGPFHPEGAGNTFPYRIDQDGQEGLIVVRGTDASTTLPPTSSPSAFPSPTTETTIPATVTTAPAVTSPTLLPPVTATTTPTTTSAIASTPAPVVVHEAKKTSSLLAVVGMTLVAAGITGLVYGRIRSRRPHAFQPGDPSHGSRRD